MDVHPQAQGEDIGQGRSKSMDSLHNHCHQTTTKEALVDCKGNVVGKLYPFLSNMMSIAY